MDARRVASRIVGDNGEPVDRLNLEDLELAQTVPERPAEARRDRHLAQIAVMLLDTAKVLDPVVTMISKRLLAWAALGASVALAVMALREPSWERLSVLAVFMLLSTLLVHRSG